MLAFSLSGSFLELSKQFQCLSWLKNSLRLLPLYRAISVSGAAKRREIQIMKPSAAAVSEPGCSLGSRQAGVLRGGVEAGTLIREVLVSACQVCGGGASGGQGQLE